MTGKEETWRLFDTLGLSVDQGLRERFEKYIDELLRWNQKINLTATKKPEEILSNHILCSLSYLMAFTPKPGLQAIDIGSGAGFPGIPLKIYSPDLSLTLLEPSQKKLAFLRHIGRLLQLKDVTYLAMPVEGMDREKTFDLAFARGFGPLSRLARKAGRALRMGGLLLVRKEKNYLGEIKAAAAILAWEGLKLDKVVAITQDRPRMEYYILAFKKCST